MANTSDKEWSELIDGLVKAVRSGKTRDFLSYKVVQAGWTREFAEFAVEWAEGEITIDEAGDTGGSPDSPVTPAWSNFVSRVPLFSNSQSEARERLSRPASERIWRPWEIVALDTEFRGRLVRALSTMTLLGFCDELGQAIELLQSAGIHESGSIGLHDRYSPVFESNGQIEWFEGYLSQGATLAPRHEQVRLNTLGLGPFIDWYGTATARDWLAGVQTVGPIDLVVLSEILSKARENLLMGSDNVTVLAEFRRTLEPHARVVAVQWLGTKLRIEYQGPTPLTEARANVDYHKSANGLWGCFPFSLPILAIMSLGHSMGGGRKRYWQHWEGPR